MIAADGGLVLALGLGLLWPRQIGIALGLVAAQSGAVALSAVIRGQWVAAGLVLVFGAAVMPWLTRLLPPRAPERPAFGRWPLLLLGSVMVLLAFAAEPDGVPLAVLLLGLLLVAVHQSRPLQIAGFMAMQNGIALAGLDQSGLLPIACLLPVVPGLVLAAVWVRRS